MLRRLGQVGFSVAAGAATEAMNRRVNQRAAEQQPPAPLPKQEPSGGRPSSFERGDTKLSRLAGTVRPPPEANPVREGVQGFFTSRWDVASSAANVGAAVASGKVDLADLTESVQQAKEQVAFTARTAKVLGQGDLDKADGLRVAGAGARHAGEKAVAALTQGNPLEALKGMAQATRSGAEGAFATATVSEAGMDTLKDAVDARRKHETQKVLTSAALSTGVSVAAGMLHPALGVAVRTVGGLAVGHQVGEAAARIHGGSETGEVGAMRAEFRKIVDEKAHR